MGLAGFNRARRQKKEKAEKVNYEKKVEEYHKGRGWYELPDVEGSLRREEAIEVLKEGD